MEPEHSGWPSAPPRLDQLRSTDFPKFRRDAVDHEPDTAVTGDRLTAGLCLDASSNMQSLCAVKGSAGPDLTSRCSGWHLSLPPHVELRDGAALRFKSSGVSSRHGRRLPPARLHNAGEVGTGRDQVLRHADPTRVAGHTSTSSGVSPACCARRFTMRATSSASRRPSTRRRGQRTRAVQGFLRRWLVRYSRW